MPHSECLVVFSGSERNPQWQVPLAVYDFGLFQKLCNIMSLTNTTRIYFKIMLFSMFTSWLGVDATILTRVTVSRWRWALMTFLKSCYNSTENRAISLTGWHKPPTKGGWKKHWKNKTKTCWLLLGRLHEAFAKLWLRSCVPTPAAILCFDGFTVKVTCVRDSQEDRCDHLREILCASCDCEAEKCVLLVQRF